MHEKTGKIQRPSLQTERLPHRCEGSGPVEPKLEGEGALVQEHCAPGRGLEPGGLGFAEERCGLVIQIVNQGVLAEELLRHGGGIPWVQAKRRRVDHEIGSDERFA